MIGFDTACVRTQRGLTSWNKEPSTLHPFKRTPIPTTHPESSGTLENLLNKEPCLLFSIRINDICFRYPANLPIFQPYLYSSRMIHR